MRGFSPSSLMRRNSRVERMMRGPGGAGYRGEVGPGPAYGRRWVAPRGPVHDLYTHSSPSVGDREM